jgi:colanic acid/amylovoran biosynthesis glycosyltransferase
MSVRIAYLSTHYPLVSHTFIQREIIALQHLGIDVFPVALNQAHDGDLLTDTDRSEAARTFYVKGMGKGRIATTLIATTLRHPVAVLKGMGRAVAGSGLDLSSSLKRLLQFLEAMLVWRHTAKHDITAIHAHFGQAPATVARAAAAFGADVGRGVRTWSVTMHGWNEFVTEDTADLRTKINDAQLVVGISDFTRAQLMRISDPSSWPHLAVVRCGLALADFPQRNDPGMSDTPTIVITARLSAEKGHLVLVEALSMLRERGTTMRARFIGSGPFRDEIASAISRFGVDELIEFTGALPPAEVAAELRAADIFCLPTFAEGLPVSIMEAMAVGVPVVTTYISGIPELVTDGVTGWVVPASNAALLADKLAEVRGDDRLSIVQAARERVQAQHDIAINAPQLAALLRSCHSISSRGTAV